MEIRDAPKLKRVKRLDSIRLDRNDSTYFTDEGYLVDHPILTSCGVFEYTNPDGSTRRELRLPEYVFDGESLKTYKGKPIIITHEAGVVDKNNVDREQIGTILTDGYEDGEDVRAEIIIHDTDAMKRSGLRELSLGYNLDLLEEPGVWNGQPYDAIQTNIAINHLAIVASARAGEQARLNIDGSDEETLKGGKKMKLKTTRTDGETLTPEELEQAIKEFKERRGEVVADSDEDVVEDVNPEEDAKEEETASDGDDASAEGTTPEDIANAVKERQDRRDNEDPENNEEAKKIIAQQDDDIDMLLAALEKCLAELKGHADEVTDEEVAEEEENKDSSDDESKALNADSADKIVRQRLAICRIGDKLNMDGLENMSIKQAKRAIISKVLPTMRVDGKSDSYIDAMYDLAVGEVNSRKTIAYQRQQMANQATKKRADSSESMATSARKRMIEREGGNE